MKNRANTLLDVDCGAGLRHLHGMRADAMRIGRWKSRMQPLQRGHIARLFDRVQATGHRREVQRTWHTGIGQLRREPRFVLHLPLLCQVQQQHKPFRQWPTQARTVAATAALALLAACGGGGAQDPENAAPGTATTQPVNCTATPKACA